MLLQRGAAHRRRALDQAAPTPLAGTPILNVDDVRVTLSGEGAGRRPVRRHQAAARGRRRELPAARRRDAGHRRRKRLRQVDAGARRGAAACRASAGNVTFLGRNLLPSEQESDPPRAPGSADRVPGSARQPRSAHDLRRLDRRAAAGLRAVLKRAAARGAREGDDGARSGSIPT